MAICKACGVADDTHNTDVPCEAFECSKCPRCGWDTELPFDEDRDEALEDMWERSP